MKNALNQFSLDDIRRANSKMAKRDSSSGKITSNEIKLSAGGKTKVISTKVNSAEIREAWAKATKK